MPRGKRSRCRARRRTRLCEGWVCGGPSPPAASASSTRLPSLVGLATGELRLVAGNATSGTGEISDAPRALEVQDGVV